MTPTPEQLALQQILGVRQGHAEALADALQDMPNLPIATPDCKMTWVLD